MLSEGWEEKGEAATGRGHAAVVMVARHLTAAPSLGAARLSDGGYIGRGCGEHRIIGARGHICGGSELESRSAVISAGHKNSDSHGAKFDGLDVEGDRVGGVHQVGLRLTVAYGGPAVLLLASNTGIVFAWKNLLLKCLIVEYSR